MKTFNLILNESSELLQLIMQAFFKERLILCALFLLITFPYLLFVTFQARKGRLKVQDESPFVYAMR